jgi:murein DD-endopeptidase MepM/ murein hydrolase activator NlpD
MFAEREIFLRTHGQVRFIRITARAQKIAAAVAIFALLAWGGLTLAMAYNQASVSIDRQLLSVQKQSVAGEAKAVSAYKNSVGDIAKELDRRQDMLDEMVRSQFGPQTLDKAVVGQQPATNPANHKTSSSDNALEKLPAASTLRALETRQIVFARKLATLIDQRARKAEAAIRSFGLNPEQMLAKPKAQGGPFIPWSRDLASLDSAFGTLADSITRLNSLERALATIPSGRPTNSPSLTSSYGFRHDPFTGAAAFHAGLDFPGTHGQPILAAAAGRVSFVGVQSGYGNCVEIDHGNGIMTRYAHLTGFNTRVGETVPRGLQIGRMGSTGRSTGTHLHFEVRVNGAAINPRRFLEAAQDVLQIQQIAKQRIGNVRV